MRSSRRPVLVGPSLSIVLATFIIGIGAASSLSFGGPIPSAGLAKAVRIRPPSPTPPDAPPGPTPPGPTPGPGYFGTLPVGAALPSDAECAAWVRPAAEVRARNAVYNATRGRLVVTNGPQPAAIYNRATGNFVGTTDEIIQWAACKWGIDENMVRAQAVIESWWDQEANSDGGESFGLMQVRQPYWGWAFPEARTSTAFNVDVALAGRRACFEGYDTWLNTVERGATYAAGDLWGCMGLWFAGRWYTQPAQEYIGRVQQELANRTWQSPTFLAYG